VVLGVSLFGVDQMVAEDVLLKYVEVYCIQGRSWKVHRVIRRVVNVNAEKPIRYSSLEE
jgi:hypothetical protein